VNPKAEFSGIETSKVDAVVGARPPQRYRVCVKQNQGSRSRILGARASSEQEARGQALAELGQGWQVLQVECE